MTALLTNPSAGALGLPDFGLTATDLFAGGGGFTYGAHQVPGVWVRMAINHWDVAVSTHQANHPTTDHRCADISQMNPRLIPRTNLLLAGPECTWHTGASGRKRYDQGDLFTPPADDDQGIRSRATMWDVVRFAEVHQYDAMIVENVVEARQWPLWPAWLMALDLAGYHIQIVCLNSAYAQAGGPAAAQSRDRMYVICWRKGNRKPDLHRWTRPQAWCLSCDERITAMQAWKDPARRFGVHGEQYVWRCPNAGCRGAEVFPEVIPAASVIDWTLPIKTTAERKNPLVPKTLARVRKGLDRYGRHIEASPGWLIDDYNGDARFISRPLPTLTTVQGDALFSVADHIDDVKFRMLTVAERKAAAALPPDFVLHGKAKDKHRLIGNVVTPPAARDLVSAVVESLS